MSDFVFTRRDFLKLVGIGAAGAASGCARPPADRLIPYLIPPEDILPGVPYWYASTCRECPAGCGILVKAREGRAIKIEGNPGHPLNRGGLCSRGQAALQGLYDPDRVRTPMMKQAGAWKSVTWDEALKAAGEKLGAAARAKKGVAVLTGHETGSLGALATAFAAAAGGTHLAWEPFGHESLREANRRSFGVASVPAYDFAKAENVITFGADFLETWLSPVQYARDFATMRARPGSYVIAVEPRLSLTGANADEWVAARPGGEMALALGMARVILSENLGPMVAERGALLDAVSAFTPEAVERDTDVPAAQVTAMARRFANSHPSLAVAGGISTQSEQSVALLSAVNLLNYVAGNVGATVRFDRTQNFDGLASFGELQTLIQSMSEGKVEVLIVHGANPAYATPAWAGFAAAQGRVGFKISLSGVLDETAEGCDLLLPSLHSIESLGDAEPARGVHAMQQPAMQKVPAFDARCAGDTLLALARGAALSGAWAADWTSYVQSRWKPLHQRLGGGREFDVFWNEALQNGGVFEAAAATPVRWSGTLAFATPQIKGAGDLTLVIYPSPNLYDGRGANKSWLQELPDPTSKAVWGSWAEIHPETAKKLGVTNGDPLKVETEAGSVEVPAYVYAGVRRDVVAIPLGQGHSAYGRSAKGRGVNALELLSPAEDGASGALAYLGAKARVSKGAKAMDLVMTQSAKDQRDRELAQVIPVAVLLGGAAAGEIKAAEAAARGGPGTAAQLRPGTATEPLAHPPGYQTPAHAVTAYQPGQQVRAPRENPVASGSYQNAKHRWAMAIDLNSCTGCSACAVACMAENNVPTVGPEMIKRGREMSWIRIERYEENLAPGRHDVRHLPMMCQHCGDAPCEVVCPVYATYHNPEGLNAQIYNRCVGTRYCSNNCPYKVRAFNWFDYAAPEKPTFAFPEPLNWQLNPDVTVRSKGVMEKCTMCVQRILEGKGNAKDEKREVRDGEIQTACAQSCPTEAIVFGDLMDPESRVSRLSHGERRYWALNELNTKPGVTYLKKTVRPESA
ncbi:MAG: molybdopterin-dependent oxidoreductase [Candidatus Eisenbacteria bacterium]|nr:molybdopterin-dependent oxidoreductase [Candidatus Eisenbacteria bacterium]